MTAEVPAAPQPDDLQFDRAEFVNRAASPSNCAVCQRPLGSAYYVANGRVVCEACRGRIGTSLAGGSGPLRFVRAIAAGVAAAALGAGIYFAIAALTGYEIGLVAIVVGLLVGYAVRWGSHGRGGWPYQLLAMALTYAAIVSTYVPYISLSAGPSVDATAQADAPSHALSEPPNPAQGPADAPLVDSPPADAPPAESSLDQSAAEPSAADQLAELSGPRKVVRWVLIFALACAVPFLLGFKNVMGWIIIGIGLYEAWKLNQRVRLEFSGPFAVTSSGGPATSGGSAA